MSKFILSCFADEIDKNHNIQIEVMKKNNINYVELRGIDGINVGDLTFDQARKYKKIFDVEGIKVSSLGSPIGKIGIEDPFDEHLNLFKKLLEFTKIFDTKYIRMFSFFMPSGEDPDRYRNEVIKRWQSFADAAKDYDVILLHENEKEIYGDIPRRCIDIINSVKSDQIALIFDPANFIQCGVETKEAFESMKSMIKYIHIKDALWETKEVVPSGQGDGKIEEILYELKKMNYNGFLSLEPHLAAFEGLSKLENEIDTTGMEKAGEKTFTVALNALLKIIKKVGVSYE